MNVYRMIYEQMSCRMKESGEKHALALLSTYKLSNNRVFVHINKTWCILDRIGWPKERVEWINFTCFKLDSACKCAARVNYFSISAEIKPRENSNECISWVNDLVNQLRFRCCIFLIQLIFSPFQFIQSWIFRFLKRISLLRLPFGLLCNGTKRKIVMISNWIFSMGSISLNSMIIFAY